MVENRINKAFEHTKKNKENCLICFVTAGDPGIDETFELVLALEAAGADIVELGMPFSDPMADGPVIQRSSERALKNQVSLHDIIALVKRLREKTEIPLLLMGYSNPIMQYGMREFAQDLSKAGGDAALVVDLIPEVAADFNSLLKASQLHQIFLLAPTSHEPRVDEVLNLASGFIYYVSMTGVTGTALNVAQEKAKLKKHLAGISAKTQLPIAIGFGIRKPADVVALKGLSQGVVVGSVIIETLEKAQNFKKGLEEVKKLVANLKNA